jgi:hypothetical protein
MKYARPLLPVLLLLAGSVIDARAQANSVRLKVTKMESTHRQTTYQTSDGSYRQQQVKSAVYYTIEVVNLNTTGPADLKIKWAILVDPSKAEAQGGGYSMTKVAEKVVSGERQSKITLGQRYTFDTDPIDLDTVTTSYDTGGQRFHSGGSIQGYLVEVYNGDRLVASDSSSQNIKHDMEQLQKSDKTP